MTTNKTQTPDDLATVLASITDPDARQCLEALGDADMAPAYLQAVIAIARLLDLAGTMEARARLEPTVTGSAGQPVLNPAWTEARLGRTSAINALRQVASMAAPGSASAAGSALAGKRWRHTNRAAGATLAPVRSSEEVEADIRRRLAGGVG